MNFPIPVFFVSSVIFVAYLTLKRNRQTQNQNDANISFLERERLADNTRKKDISNLDYLPFSMERLPVSKDNSKELTAVRADLTELAGRKIINLSDYSNTDLKLMYGPANLAALSEYDDNYHRLATTLFAYASLLAGSGQNDAAIAVLEYAMELRIQLSRIYLLLAELYTKQHTPEKIRTIQDTLSAMEGSFASHVLPGLDEAAKKA